MNCRTMKKHKKLQKAAEKYAKKTAKYPYDGPEQIFTAGALWAARAIKREFIKSWGPQGKSAIEVEIANALGTGEGRE